MLSEMSLKVMALPSGSWAVSLRIADGYDS
jgi:hypothetical protein